VLFLYFNSEAGWLLLLTTKFSLWLWWQTVYYVILGLKIVFHTVSGDGRWEDCTDCCYYWLMLTCIKCCIYQVTDAVVIVLMSLYKSFTYLLTYLCWCRAAIHKTVSVVLLLGNMQFKQEKNSDQAVMPDDTGICLSQLLCVWGSLMDWSHAVDIGWCLEVFDDNNIVSSIVSCIT